MKYINILAGVFGLMALSACNDNNEVTVEQPKEVHTITVAYGRSANTRLNIVNQGYEYGELFFKSSWSLEDNDAIKLIAENGTEYIYNLTAVNEDGTGTFTREGSAPADGTYKVVFPASWDGSLSAYNNQNKTCSYNDDETIVFDIYDYQQAMAIATCEGGSFSEIALKPIFNFLFIPEDLKIKNMEKYNWDEYVQYQEDYERYVYSSFVELSGVNLYKTINNYAGGDKGKITINTVGKYPVFPLWHNENEDENVWKFEYDFYIAFPVLPNQEPITNLSLLFDGLACHFVDHSGNDWAYTEGGHVYYLENGNLKFDEPVIK